MPSTTIQPTTNTPVISTNLDSASLIGFSPEAILEYCASQITGLDSQVAQLEEQQQQQVNEQTQVNNVVTALSAYSPNPTTPEQMNACYTAYQSAINALPPGDPVRSELQTKFAAFQQQYPATQFSITVLGTHLSMDTLASTPTEGQWSSTTSDLTNYANSLKTDSQLQMLQLQDLCSQQQDAIEQATNMMSKADDTLLDQAKAIGQ